MSQRMPGGFPYDHHSIIRNAPPVSGVYVIYSPSECVYVGESDDICASLLEIYYEGNPCLNDKYLTHFSFDLVAPQARVARQADRIQEFRPACNLQTGASNGGQCRTSERTEPGRPLAISRAPSL
jgi:hypothetical protein